MMVSSTMIPFILATVIGPQKIDGSEDRLGTRLVNPRDLVVLPEPDELVFLLEVKSVVADQSVVRLGNVTRFCVDHSIGVAPHVLNDACLLRGKGGYVWLRYVTPRVGVLHGVRVSDDGDLYRISVDERPHVPTPHQQFDPIHSERSSLSVSSTEPTPRLARQRCDLGST